MNKAWSGIALACIALVLGPPPFAGPQSLEEALRACEAESNDMRRLACYDRSVAPWVKAPAATAPAAPPAAGAPPAAAAASDFGTRNGPLDARRYAREPKQVTAAVSGVEQRQSGLLVITLDNGQTWIQNQAAEYFPLKVGDTVEIRSAALGSYLLFAPSKRATRVTRIR